MEEKKEKKYNGAKIGFFLFFVLFLMWTSFNAGLYICGSNEFVKRMATEEAVFLGNLTGKFSTSTPEQLAMDVDFSLFWDVWKTLKENYVDKDDLTDKKMFYGALKGLVSSAEDPYTVFMNPVISKEFSDDLSGTFEGIGAEIGIKNDVLTVVAPLPEMPAEKAGLKAGDKILSINGDSTAGISIDEAISKIRGPKNSEVTLSIFREGVDGVNDYVVNRDKIVVKSVKTETTEDDLLIIKVSHFNEDTEKLFNNAVAEAISKNPKGIILDLRNNPGGFFNTSIEMASEWVENSVVVKEMVSGDNVREHPSRGRARLKDFNTVILINEGSASASEIVSGALQDHGKAVLVGKKTFGKGSVQQLIEIKDGSSVKITVAKWLTPNDRNITEEGILPDIEIELTLEDFNDNKDPQMDKAKEILMNFDDLDAFVQEAKNASSTKEN
jgi:carboxyl-terminal processing protease